jgi:hypothetical protein
LGVSFGRRLSIACILGVAMTLPSGPRLGSHELLAPSGAGCVLRAEPGGLYPFEGS